MENWEFEYGPAENDPEYGVDQTGESGNTKEAEDEAATTEGSGRWVHKLTGERLGSKDGSLEFTVVG